MLIPSYVIANADDLGLSSSVNKAILYCFENELINSTSLITNTLYFDETVNLIHENSIIRNIGIHINIADGRPITNFIPAPYIDDFGNWNLEKIEQKFTFLPKVAEAAFWNEILAQIDKAIDSNIQISHLDSHYHLHTLPCFYQLFLKAAEKYKIKLRLAQTYNEGNYLKYLYRKRINSLFIDKHLHYANYFETVTKYLSRPANFNDGSKFIEIMLHPDFDYNGNLTDHYDKQTMEDWMTFLGKK
jgi:predicted glycoside hydrolase/deacetylase ChbG (UPF0249 family)